jgi:hypothetical protein
MKQFKTIALSMSQVKKDLNELKRLLNDPAKPSLSEKNDILPFFNDHEHISGFMGSYNSGIIDHKNLGIAFEFDIFGDHVADLAIGDKKNNQYCFVEFEDATETSVFKKGPRAAREWSTRFEHGFSQLIDWTLWIENNRGTAGYVNRFGTSAIQFNLPLVIGRDKYVSAAGLRDRMIWRSEQVVVASRKVNCITFDKLYNDLSTRLEYFNLQVAAL